MIDKRPAPVVRCAAAGDAIAAVRLLRETESRWPGGLLPLTHDMIAAVGPSIRHLRDTLRYTWTALRTEPAGAPNSLRLANL
jgi:hypothetical protein